MAAAAVAASAMLVQDHGGEPAGEIDADRLAAIPPLQQKHHAVPVASDPGGSTRGERPKSYRVFLGEERVASILAENEDAALYDWLRGEGGMFVNSAKVVVR